MPDQNPPIPDPAPRAPKLLDQVRRLLQARHMSAKTAKSYVGWIRRYVLFHGSGQGVRRLFRGKLLAGLKALHTRGSLRLPADAGLDDPLRFSAFLSELYGKEWVVHVKPPFAGPETVLRYLGRYTYRIAISNQRLVGLEGDEVLFRYKDRAEDERWKTMRLVATEFIRRFLRHVLPDRLVRIRYFGLLAHRHRRRLLALCRDHLGVSVAQPAAEPPAEPLADTWQERLLRLTGFDILQCPSCKTGRLQAVAALPARPAALPARAPPR